MDVDEGGDGLDGSGLLRMFDEVALAGLVLGIPVEAIMFSSAYVDRYKTPGVYSTCQIEGRRRGWRRIRNWQACPGLRSQHIQTGRSH